MSGSATMELEPAAAEAQAAAGGKVVAARSSILDSIRGCGLAGMRVDKEELRRMILMPKYLRVAMAVAVRMKDWNAGVTSASSTANRNSDDQAAPEAPMVVFVNSRSGGRHGPALKIRLQDLIAEEQIFDLSAVKPSDFVQYGLTCLEKLADLGDNCAKATRAKLRVIVAGGDGTVGWVLGALAELFVHKREPVPPTGIIPLGTGNDLSRSFDWGGSFPFAWRSAVKHTLYKAVTGPVCRLDSWHVVVVMPDGESIELPHSLRRMEKITFGQDQDVDIDGELPEKISCFEGVYYNYFSIGMDAQVAYGFHRLRNKKPYLAQGPISNKLIYSSYSCTQGWFCTPCVNEPGLRGLKNILRLYIKKANCADWEQILIPSSVRAIVALNLQNYASGRHPWGRPEPEYLEKRGFVEAHADDGLLEIFGIKQGWHASFVMTEIISAKHIAQAAAIKMEIRGGQWKQAYLQMDGEPWKQPIVKDFSTHVVIKRVPFQSLMISGK
ncbi:diacylglycerol kinase 7 isoform X2 [Elaeis guineensis]|uniref:Diacylglycerol kinase n=1 Tax=Elaeis guineensis var. tenera TaxID=51953 RepID=A0A6I9RMA9_ELAGV|nr:diacylglycerol kinase 7 isoform X2 [Elaeis guineensis]